MQTVNPKPGFDLSEELTMLRGMGLVGAFDEPSAAEAFQKAFEQIGGSQRLMLWADRHPALFYKLYARMVIPTIAPVLPKPPAATEESWPDWLRPLGLPNDTDPDDAAE